MVETFAGNMRRIIKLREALSMQTSTVVQIPKAKNRGVLIQVFQLSPKNSLKATAAVNVINFGELTAAEEFSLLKTLVNGNVELEDLQTGEKVSQVQGEFSVSVPPRTARTYVVRSVEQVSNDLN